MGPAVGGGAALRPCRGEHDRGNPRTRALLGNPLMHIGGP